MAALSLEDALAEAAVARGEAPQEEGSEGEGSSGEEEEDTEGGEWQTAAKSNTSARKQRRKVGRTWSHAGTVARLGLGWHSMRSALLQGFHAWDALLLGGDACGAGHCPL